MYIIVILFTTAVYLTYIGAALDRATSLPDNKPAWQHISSLQSNS